MNATRRFFLSAWVGAVLVLATIANAHAVPSFARQTGQACVACHVSWPELTPYGRYFKLSGYTLGRNLWVEAAKREAAPPLSVMAQLGITWINQPKDATGNQVIYRDGQLVFPGGSLFLAGKFTDNIGAFVQYTLSTLEPSGDGTGYVNKGLSDNTDIRAVYQGSDGSNDLILGLNMNNNPTVQDASNSTPAWGYPYTSSPVAPAPNAAPIISGGLAQVSAGYGGYFYWNNLLYGEFSVYQAANGFFSWMAAGHPTYREGGTALQGYNPYWRLYVNRDWGAHSVLVGTYGMQAKLFPDPTFTTGPTDRFTDYGFDAQYQYITDPHTLTAHANYVYETQNYNASFANGGTSNPSNHLNALKLWGTYYYQRKYGATAGGFWTTGSSDATLYGTTLDQNTGLPVATRPNSSGYILELDYLPFQGVRNINLRLMLQYVGYTQFNGAQTNVDGFGRSASANNSLFFNIWFLL
jgi:hypothetical protein